MQIVSVLKTNNFSTGKTNKMAQFARKNDKFPASYRPYHRYTGNASKDLAWASMYDNQIARELKMMGLI